MTSLLTDLVKSCQVARAIANVRAGDFAIGSQNQLLPECKSKQDWDRFVKMSYSHDVLLMGTSTANSISKVWRDTGIVLPGRRVVVASRNFLHNIPADLDLSKSSVLVCGGAQIYKELLPYCFSVYLTVTKPKPGLTVTKADSYFPIDLLDKHFSFWPSPSKPVSDGQCMFQMYLRKK